MNIEDAQEEQSKGADGQENDQKEEEDESEEEGEDGESCEDPDESDGPDSHSDLESSAETEEEDETPKKEQRQTPGGKSPKEAQKAQKAAAAELPYVFAGEHSFLFPGWDLVPSLAGLCCFLNSGYSMYLRVSLPGDAIANARSRSRS